MPIRLLCCSDTHDRLPPALPEADATAWLHGGDVYDLPGFTKAPPGLSDNAHPDVDAWARRRSIPVYTVRGNHDYADPYDFFIPERNVSGRVVRLGEHLLLAGVGFAYSRTLIPPLEAELEEVCVRVQRHLAQEQLPGDRVVILSHYPMRRPGLFPEKSWERLTSLCFQCVTSLVEVVRPVLVIQGHLHEWHGLTAKLKIKKSTRHALVVMPGPKGMIIEVRGDRAEVVEGRDQ
jgi:Icc-related predicted phosphoesterase